MSTKMKPSRFDRLMLGFRANGSLGVLAAGPEGAASNPEAWAGLGWLGPAAWSASPLVLPVVLGFLAFTAWRGSRA
jgi:hypothetical protein